MEVSRLVSMEPVMFLVIAFFSCHLYLASASHWTKALYPSAYRVKRATPVFINPTFQKSVKDVNLLYEILLSGLHLDEEEEEEDSLFAKVDKELASLRCAQTLEVICKDVLPRKLSEIRRLIAELRRRRSSSSSGGGGRPSGSSSSSSSSSSTSTTASATPLRREDFERTVLTMVYMAQRLAVTPEGHQRDMWAETLLELQRAVRQDLMLS